MIFLDTGYLIALAKPGDALHRRAIAWTRVLHEPLAVTEFVLVETVDALSLPADRNKAHALIEDLPTLGGCRIVPVSSELLRHGLRLHRPRPDKEWSLSDCISFHVMGELGIYRALAYDQHFEQAGLEALLRRDTP